MTTLHWKLLAGGLLIAALIGLWMADRRGQYDLGSERERAATNETITESKGKITDAKDAASRAASDAARRVCDEGGADPLSCLDL